MPRVVVGLAMFLLIALSVFADCTCRKIAHGESTHWGGSQLVVQNEEKPYKELKGIVLDPNSDAVTGALVEIWTNPDYLLRNGRQTPEEKSKQQKLKACLVAKDGKFCFHVKPGKYEVRVSIGSGWNVTKAYVIIDPHNGEQEPLRIGMHLGT
ncbi:MAG TPA: hypothetical protein VGF61_14030 [Candidatus Acidoferrum sp.]